MSVTINGETLAKELSALRGISHKEAKEVVADYWGLVNAHVEAGDVVKITGQLQIETVQRAERKGRNPQTGEEIQIEARPAIRVKPLTGLKRLAN